MFVYALHNVSSCDVERSFSIYKKIVTKSRLGFKAEDVKAVLIIK